SDRIGRTRILTLGLLAFAGSMAAYALADGAWLLGLGRVLQGVAVVATFQIGAAYLGDITSPGQRAVAFGSYTTAMGLGFTVGPILGGQIAETWDARTSYAVAVVLSLLGALMIRRLLHEPPRRVAVSRGAWIGQLGLLLRRRDLTLVSAGNLLVSFTFAGAISTFLPLYARNAGISEATIGTLFAVRAFVSAAGRIPNSIITRRVGSQPILLGALVLQVVVMFGIAQTTSTLWLAVLLGIDGLAFGGYLVAGQTWVADHTEPAYRGAAVGLYSAASSIGGILAPLLLGIVAEIWSVGVVFTVNGWIMAAGGIVYLATVALQRGTSDRAAPS
ncbi:MAG: MFS transporter, partial [Acidobacteriota bacterium]|nr:MFS transporter [Acidobacteriota bacterium]MDQ3549071.1 MFS transporter [Chloroflexota bacterium]